MQFKQSTAHIFVPDGLPDEQALARTTHMAISAHQDDIEIMAVDGILQCFQQPDQWFTGMVMTNGAGSPRAGLYAHYTDEQMRDVRLVEQKKAAVLGGYAAQVLLDYPSGMLKDSAHPEPLDDLLQVLHVARPRFVYTHNLADKHPTHVAVGVRVIQALRKLPAAERPEKVYGCEVWRGLDWMMDEEKIVFNTTDHENLQMALLGVYDSQISGGKRYDLASLGRRRANATYYASHAVDVVDGMVIGMDLTPLVQDTQLAIGEYVQDFIRRFSADVDRLIQSVS
jgi:LmbE family N-acetylglucosaminyl deacetylase